MNRFPRCRLLLALAAAAAFATTLRAAEVRAEAELVEALRLDPNHSEANKYLMILRSRPK